MLYLLYPAGVNWFHERLARDLSEDLAAEGVTTRLLSPGELGDLHPGEVGRGDDIAIVNANECVETLSGPVRGARERVDVGRQFWPLVENFNRRILVNLDAIYTPWFLEQLNQVGSRISEIFDVSMATQSRRALVAGHRYRWIPESFTRRGRGNVPRETEPRTIPWALVGHRTPDRLQLAEALSRTLGASGVAYLPNLRPFACDGSRNLAEPALRRLLGQSQYYVWVSHHEFPYHEGLRALHAIAAGSVPAKIDPLFANDFADIPWVYPSIAAFVRATRETGFRELYRRAREYALVRDTLGAYFATALYGPLAHATAMGGPGPQRGGDVLAAGLSAA